MHTISCHSLRTFWDKMSCSLFNMSISILFIGKLEFLSCWIFTFCRIVLGAEAHKLQNCSYFSISALLTGDILLCEVHQAFRCQVWQEEERNHLNGVYCQLRHPFQTLSLLWMQMCQCSVPSSKQCSKDVLLSPYKHSELKCACLENS